MRDKFFQTYLNSDGRFYFRINPGWTCRKDQVFIVCSLQSEQMKINVDYHFHPNLPLNHMVALRKVKKIYLRCQEMEINCLLITEHSYKNPRRAYNYMKSFLPANFYIFPGVEYITRDKIDIIVFSRDEKIYDYPELRSFMLSFEELVDFVISKPDLEAFVTHPFTLGGTGIVRRKGIFFTRMMIDKLGAVEMSYTVFSSLKKAVNRHTIMRKIFARSLYKIGLNEILPREFYPKNIKFLAAGSDAHHIKQIGTCCELAVIGEVSTRSVFQAIISNKRPRIRLLNAHTPYLMIRSGMTSFGEFFCKQRKRAGNGVRKKLIGLRRKILSRVDY